MPSPVHTRLRYIPFRKKDIVEMCLSAGGLEAGDQLRFREFGVLLESVYHFEYHARLEALKDTYAPHNPDRDTRVVAVHAEHPSATFVDSLESLLNAANYERLPDDAMTDALKQSSLFKVRIEIDFNEFDEFVLFTRGESTRTEQVSRFFGLLKSEIVFVNFDRVVIYIRFGENKVGYKPGATLLKLFRNVPKSDVEMLFPNTEVRMRMRDKLMIGVPAIVGAGLIVTTKLGTSLVLLGALFGFWLGLRAQPVQLDQAGLIALVAGVGGLGSYIWRQYTNFRTRKLEYMQSLTQSLYFRNLDNNAGVFHRLIDDAEEEECKEAILAYYFLLSNGASTAQDLDTSIERWFVSRWQCEIDFEIDDALGKLVELGLATQTDNAFAAIEIAAACRALDTRWDKYFRYE